MASQCEKIKQEYENLKTLKSEFDLELKKAVETGNLGKAKKLKAELEQKRDAFFEKLWIFENLPPKELKEQYESQKGIMKNVGILEKLSNGEMGIKGIDNKEYAYPSYQEIARRMRENKEMLKTKTEQGFNQLLIVPFGMKLDDLIEKYRQVILKHHQEGKLLATKEKETDPDEPLELNESQPVWVWDKYQNADTDGELVYFPEEFSENHNGKTKEQILSQTKSGFNILLIEDLPNIPRGLEEDDNGNITNYGEVEEKGGRKQIAAGGKPKNYLKRFKTDPQYQNETGMTPEEQIICAIKHLEEKNQVIDDWQGKGSLSYQLGAYFTADGYVPGAVWYRDGGRADVGRRDPGNSYSGNGVRAAVRVP